jgi:hypothetical protein
MEGALQQETVASFGTDHGTLNDYVTASAHGFILVCKLLTTNQYT